jgi:hypothetical protein
MKPNARRAIHQTKVSTTPSYQVDRGFGKGDVFQVPVPRADLMRVSQAYARGRMSRISQLGKR